MLVLSRRANETVVFPDLGITLEVIRLKGNTVRLGIKAPDSVRILRGELEADASDFHGQDFNGLPALSVSFPVSAESNVA